MKSEYQPKIRINEGKHEVFDLQRGRYVAFTPEESVRQKFVYQLINEFNYPAGRIGIESSIKVNRLVKRTDIVVFNLTGKPWMIVECKAPRVKITQEVFDQVARYNYVLKADYLILTNGTTLIISKIDYENNQCNFVTKMPVYPVNE